MYEVDEKGNGQTISTEPKEYTAHVHKIIGWKVQEINDHIHTIKE